MTKPNTPDQEGLPPIICGACNEHFYGTGAAKAALLHMATEHSEPNFEANTDTAGMPSSSMNTPATTLREQLDGYFAILDHEVIDRKQKTYIRHLKLADQAKDQLEALCQEIAREAVLKELNDIQYAAPFDEEDGVVDAKRGARGQAPLQTLDRYVNERIAELTQKPPQPPLGGLEDSIDSLVAFMEKLGWEYHPNKYYSSFTKNEGTCELTMQGAQELKAALQAYLYRETLELLPEKKPLTTDLDEDNIGEFEDVTRFCVECGQYEFEGQLNCRCCGYNAAIDDMEAKAKAKYNKEAE